MNIRVNYVGADYGTGAGSSRYAMSLQVFEYHPTTSKFPRRTDGVKVEFRFMRPVEGISRDKPSGARVRGASLEMDVHEARQLAAALLYSIEHAKLTRSKVEVEYKVKIP